MKIARLCYNNIKRKKVQLLLALFFLLAFTVRFYITIQQPTKTVIYVDDVNHIPKGLSKSLFLKPNKVEDFSFEQSDQDTTDDKLENFRDDIKNLSVTKSSDVRQITLKENNMLEYVNSNFGNKLRLPAEQPPFVSSHEKNQTRQHENITFSLQGFLNLHVWEKVCHFQVESLRKFILFPQAPSKRRLLTSSSLFSEKESNFGERMFGFISTSTSGQYQFAISSSGNSELWLSSDETSANLRKIASLGSRDNPGRGKPRNYMTDSSQVSTTFSLTKSMKYFIDVLHKHKSGKVHLEVAWRFADETEFNIIASEYMLGKVNDSHVPDNSVQLADYNEQPQQSRDSVRPFFNSEEVKEILSECPYEPSYLVKHKLIRFQGARNKSNTHFAAVYPPDTSNNSVALMKNEDIWWQENAAGNELTNPNMAKDVTRLFMDALEAKYPQLYALQEIISVEHVPDPLKGDRFLLELRLSDKQTGGSVLLSEHVYKSLAEDSKLCYPQGFRWNKSATVNIIVPVKNSGRWALYFIKNVAEVISQTQDFNVHVIIVDYESKDIDIEAVLKKSTIKWYSIVRIPGEQGFQRAVALQRGAAVVTDPHGILFMCDLNLKIPSNLISTIRKIDSMLPCVCSVIDHRRRQNVHCVEGKMAFAPVVKRLRCGYYPDLPFGYWETLGFGLIAIYKSDFDRVGGMNIREFSGWGGEDWELLDRILMSGMEVERLKIPDFYHFFHPSFSGSNQRVGA